MKSILQEDSSVCKAIAKAWDSCQRPSEFTVKILSVEEKNLFGFVKKPAVISISYLPEKRTLNIKKEENKNEKVLLQNKKHSEYNEQFHKKNEQAKSGIFKKNIQDAPIIIWKKEYLDFVEKSLKDILHIIGFNADFNITVDNKMLNIFLDKRALKDIEDEKLFFISISTLLLQFLRKQFKKKFSNHYLIIHFKKNQNE